MRSTGQRDSVASKHRSLGRRRPRLSICTLSTRAKPARAVADREPGETAHLSPPSSSAGRAWPLRPFWRFGDGTDSKGRGVLHWAISESKARIALLAAMERPSTPALTSAFVVPTGQHGQGQAPTTLLIRPPSRAFELNPTPIRKFSSASPHAASRAKAELRDDDPVLDWSGSADPSLAGFVPSRG